MTFKEGNEAGKAFWFKKGQSGNPGGRTPKAHIIKEMERAVARKIEIEVEDGSGAKRKKKVVFAQYIAEVIAEKAAEGDLGFCKLMIEHIYGRPIQKTEVTVQTPQEVAAEINEFVKDVSVANAGGNGETESE